MSSSNLIVIIGGTGAQGGSVISALQGNKSYRIRAVTRNASSEKAKALSAKGVEVVTADVGDVESLKRAFEGATAIFANTDFYATFAKSGAEVALKTEYLQGKNLADAASSTPTLTHYIWSTIPSASALSGGKYVVPHFEGKAQTDEYITSSCPELAKKTTFLWIGFYGTNLKYYTFAPFFVPSAGKYVSMWPVPGDTPIETAGLVDVNIGLFVSSILSQPQLTQPAKYVFLRTEVLSVRELWEMLAEVKGTKVENVQVKQEDFNRVWPGMGEEMGVMLRFWSDVREKGWTRKDGGKVLMGEDLGVRGVVGQRETFEGQDWGEVLKR
ncbi:hypothetical protein FQN54_008284 [Arachnomyces sp. PD_36]|nr:hypothetical protein FQN54_008284 [Arachnomyces sp. PD_36]